MSQSKGAADDPGLQPQAGDVEGMKNQLGFIFGGRLERLSVFQILMFHGYICPIMCWTEVSSTAPGFLSIRQRNVSLTNITTKGLTSESAYIQRKLDSSTLNRNSLECVLHWLNVDRTGLCAGNKD